jgi:DNA-directed RNA polymerase specialized sigma24 family protein
MGAGRLPTTRTTLMDLAAGSGPEARAALGELCAIYWPPLFAFVLHDRRQRTEDDARDLTQQFFADILERQDLAGLDRTRGSFRCWLLQAMRNFLANRSKWERAAKRPPAALALSVEMLDVERRQVRQLTEGLDPEKLYNRRWARIVIERALASLRAELDDDKAGELDLLGEAVLGERLEGGYEALAASLGTTAGALRQQVGRWREKLRQEVAETMDLGQGGDIDAELDELIRSLA